MADELLDRDDLEAMGLREREQRLSVGAVAVFVEDLAEHTGRREPRQPREIDGGLGVAGPAQHAPLLGDEWEQVTGADEVGGHARRIEDGRDGGRTLAGRDAGAGRAVIDRHREGGAERRGVGRHHHRQVEPPGDVGQDRHADLPPALLDHEVHDAGRGLLGRAHEVPLVLAILGVDDDDHITPRDGGDGGLDGRESGGHRGGEWTRAVTEPPSL